MLVARMEVVEVVSRMTGLSVRVDVAGSGLTTFAIGGICPYLVEPDNTEELCALIAVLSEWKTPYRILGAGSNLLIDDRGLTCWIVRLGRGFRTSAIVEDGPDEVLIKVGGSHSLMSLSRELSEQGLAGLEFAGGIPASFGGALKMNAGAHGGEMKDLVDSVQVVLPGGELCTMRAAELQYSYRHSELPEGSVIAGGTIRMRRGDKREISQSRARHLEERKARQPLTLPSAGSVFKNPSPEKSAGWYIEQAGLKGRAIGGARISDKHANWIVNEERKALADDVRGLIALCQREVKSKFGVELVPEVQDWRS